MQKLCANLTAIGLHVSRLSHQLHSSELEYLGLSVAITKLCREFSDQYSIKVVCAVHEHPGKIGQRYRAHLPQSCSGVVSTILQSTATPPKFTLRSLAASGELTLTVRDNGAGFDVQESKAAPGLGLISMRERVHLIGGEFAIDSALGAGTRIWVRAPSTTASLPVANA